MSEEATQVPGATAGSRLGFAVGVGLAFVPLIGIPLRFMLGDWPAIAIYAGVFLVGFAVGALFGGR